LIVVAVLALVLAAGALVVQFVVPAKGDGASSAEVEALRAQVAAMKSGGTGLKVGFVNVDTAGKVFLDDVSDITQRLTAKQQELSDLNAKYAAGTIKQDAYQKQQLILTAEGLNASVSAQAAILDRMIAAQKFADIRTDLQTVRAQVDEFLNTGKNLEAAVKGGATSSTEIQLWVSQLQTATTKIEGIVSQAFAVKIQQAAQKVAIARGFDLILVQKNVAAYANPAVVTDITEFVKAEIADYL